MVDFPTTLFHMNGDAYEMYVLSKCIRQKHHVQYISGAKTLDKLFYHFNRDLICTGIVTVQLFIIS